MEPHELTAKLTQLHAELSDADQIDPESLELLRKLTDDIARLLDKKQETSSEDAEGVTSGLRRLMLKYESDHPELAITLGKAVDALAAMGI
jgi:Domain of unknown function (DUF4404)